MSKKQDKILNRFYRAYAQLENALRRYLADLEPRDIQSFSDLHRGIWKDTFKRHGVKR